MCFERRLMPQQLIERAIEAILVDLFRIELQQIAERGAPIPIFGDMQLARWSAQSRRHQHGHHLLPGDMLLAGRQQALAQLRQARATPQGKRQINIAELPRAFDPNALQANRHRHIPAAVIKQLGLFGSTDQMASQRPCLQPTLLVKLAKMGHRLLDDAPTNAHAAHQRPIPMDLSSLASCRVAQIHAPNHIRLAAKRKYPSSSLHPQIRPLRTVKSLIYQSHRDKLTPEFTPQLRKLG